MANEFSALEVTFEGMLYRALIQAGVMNWLQRLRSLRSSEASWEGYAGAGDADAAEQLVAARFPKDFVGFGFWVTERKLTPGVM